MKNTLKTPIHNAIKALAVVADLSVVMSGFEVVVGLTVIVGFEVILGLTVVVGFGEVLGFGVVVGFGLVVGLTVVGLTVVGFRVVCFRVVGLTVEGLTVVGLTVVGLTVVVGFGVESTQFKTFFRPLRKSRRNKVCSTTTPRTKNSWRIAGKLCAVPRDTTTWGSTRWTYSALLLT
jgi:hypothetical protein